MKNCEKEIIKITNGAIESGYNLGKEKIDFYEKQIKGLILVMQQVEGGESVSRSYVIEKLNMILNNGIGFHSSIMEKIE